MISTDFHERLGWIWRTAMAQGVTLLLLIANTMSFALPYAAQVRPFFVLMAIYYWAIFRPTLIPPLLAFLLGVGLDILSQTPLGLNALIFVVLQGVVSRQRVFLMGQPYVMIWVGFGFTVALYASVQFMAYLVITGGAPLPTQSLMSAAALTFMLFPLMSLIFVFLHRVLPQTPHA